MAKVQGWNTNGITGLGALTDGRIKLEFTGTDGAKRNIFIPADTLPSLVASLVGLSATAAKKTGNVDTIAGKHMMGLKSFAVAADDAGQEFALAMTTQDGLELRFLLDPNTIEALAAGLVSTLEKHGRSLPPMRPAGLKH